MHLITTDKFIDNSIAVRTLLPLDKDTITAYNVLLMMLRDRSEALPTKQKLSMAFKKAYGFRCGLNLSGYGNKVSLDIRFQYIRPEYIDDPEYMDMVLFLLDQMLNHPLLSKESFEEAKYLFEQRLIRQMDDPDYLALRSVLEMADPHHPISINMQGTLKQVRDLKYEDVLKAYDAFKKADKFVACTGIMKDEVISLLEKVQGSDPKALEMDLLADQQFIKKEMAKKISQTTLAQLYTTHTSIDDEGYYPLLVLNSLLGQGSMSLLFETIREKYSYCYSISSMLMRFDGAMVIYCGTNRENIAHVETLIAQIIEDICQGLVDENLLEVSKLELMDLLSGQSDRHFGMSEQAYFNILTNRHDLTLQDILDKIKKVSLSDVQKAAKKLKRIAQCCVMEESSEI